MENCCVFRYEYKNMELKLIKIITNEEEIQKNSEE